jgi:hypothetical protein
LDRAAPKFRLFPLRQAEAKNTRFVSWNGVRWNGQRAAIFAIQETNETAAETKLLASNQLIGKIYFERGVPCQNPCARGTKISSSRSNSLQLALEHGHLEIVLCPT